MTELTDELVDKIEVWLDKNGIELDRYDLDQIRNTIDTIIEKHKNEE